MEENKDARAWYKKKRYIIPIALLGLLFVLGLNDNSNTQQQAIKSTTSSYNESVKPITNSVIPAESITNNNSDLSNDNHYVNVDGQTVHSPAHASSIPAGASAQCRDGTYSFSQHRQGTCSHHGGVAEWY